MGVRVFENGLLKRMFGPNRDEKVGGWGKLNNDELHNLHSSPSIIRMIKSRRMRWAGHGEKRKAFRILVENSEGKRRLERLTRRFEDNIVTCLVTVDGYWINSYNTWLHFTVPCNTHALIFLVLVRSHVLSPPSVVASSAPILWTDPLMTTDHPLD
jgi:hypothetical protein